MHSPLPASSPPSPGGERVGGSTDRGTVVDGGVEIDDGVSPVATYPGFTDNTGGVSLDVKAVTPEPSSLVLLGTGVLGVAGAVRRRFLA